MAGGKLTAYLTKNGVQYEELSPKYRLDFSATWTSPGESIRPLMLVTWSEGSGYNFRFDNIKTAGFPGTLEDIQAAVNA